MKHFVISVVFLVLLFVGVGQVEAVPITFDFSGTIYTFIDPGGVLDGSITSNSTISGHYTFDSLLPDYFGGGDPNSAEYFPSAADGHFFVATFGNYTLTSTYKIQVASFTSEDRYNPTGSPGIIIFRNATDVFTDDQNAAIGWTMPFVDWDATALSSGALLLTPPDLSEFEQKAFYMLLFYGSNTVKIGANIDSLTLVPEPSTMLFLGSGLLGLWGFRKKFKK